jgi:hypothetical protein
MLQTVFLHRKLVLDTNRFGVLKFGTKQIGHFNGKKLQHTKKALKQTKNNAAFLSLTISPFSLI